MAEFRVRLERAGLDAYWLVSAANVRYLCGFTGDDSTLLVTAKRSLLITDSRYAEQAEQEAHVDEVVLRQGPMAQAAGLLCKSLGVKKFGLTASNVTHADYLAVASAAGPAEVVSRQSGIAEQMRMRKDALEIEAVRAALRLAEAAFCTVMPLIRSGNTEKAIAAKLDYEMRVRGAEGAAFETICAAGARASMPHAASGEAKLSRHSPVLFDWGARLGGYCSDLTRVLCTDRIAPKVGALVDVVLEAQAAAFQKLRPGSCSSDVDAAGRAVIAKSGYGANFGHGIGHGVGLAVHEGPRLGSGEETILLPGMVVTVEPGVYLPGRMGVRIEEMAVVTPNGHEVLSVLPLRPEELVDYGA